MITKKLYKEFVLAALWCLLLALSILPFEEMSELFHGLCCVLVLMLFIRMDVSGDSLVWNSTGHAAV